MVVYDFSTARLVTVLVLLSEGALGSEPSNFPKVKQRYDFIIGERHHYILCVQNIGCDHGFVKFKLPMHPPIWLTNQTHIELEAKSLVITFSFCINSYVYDFFAKQNNVYK